MTREHHIQSVQSHESVQQQEERQQERQMAVKCALAHILKLILTIPKELTHNAELDSVKHGYSALTERLLPVRHDADYKVGYARLIDGAVLFHKTSEYMSFRSHQLFLPSENESADSVYKSVIFNMDPESMGGSPLEIRGAENISQETSAYNSVFVMLGGLASDRSAGWPNAIR